MPALTTAYEAFEKPGLVVSYRISNVKLFKGALVGVNASGHVVAMDHGVSGLRFIGVAAETVDNSGGTAGGRTIAVLKAGTFVFRPSSSYTPAQTDTGRELFAVTDNEIQLSAVGLTNLHKIGTFIGLETPSGGGAGVRLRIDNYTV
jgi:hypothetical protein